MPPGMAPGENIYENVPVKREGDRPKAPLPPIPPPKGVAGVANGGLLPPIPPKNAATAAAGVAATNLLDQRMRGVSVDRYQEYKTPGYYEDTYYTRATTDGRAITGGGGGSGRRPFLGHRLRRHRFWGHWRGEGARSASGGTTTCG